MRFFKENLDYISAVIYGTFIGISIITFIILYSMHKDIEDLKERVEDVEIELKDMEYYIVKK